jgi:hypothetical protein
MIDTPVRLNAIGLALTIRESQILKRLESERHVSHAGDFGVGSFDERKSGNRDTVMLFIIREEREEIIFVGSVGIEESFVVVDHTFEL